MEERTQIKFNNPDIEGNPKPTLVSLDQETPIEGESTRENGESFTWHKWLCTNNQYFLASTSLDGMLKMIPDKMGKVLKIEKVVNPKGGHPFFQINGMNNDDIVNNITNQATSTTPIDPLTPQSPSKLSTTDDALTRLEQKLDRVLGLLNNVQEDVQEEELPF